MEIPSTTENTGTFGHKRRLADGGFPGDTMVITTRGPHRIDNLQIGQMLYSLNPTTGLLKPKPVTDIQRLDFEDRFRTIRTRRADLSLHPDQPVPYTTKGLDEIRFQRAGDVREKRFYQFINDWKVLHGKPLRQVDITDMLEEYEICATTEVHGLTFRNQLPEGCEPFHHNGFTGWQFDPETFKKYQGDIEAFADEVTIRGGTNQRRRPYKFDGEDFVQLLGWFVTEGSLTETDKSVIVQIAQQTPEHRQTIRELFDRLGITVSVTDSAFSVGTPVYADLLEKLCGNTCREKRLPAFVWTLNHAQKRLLLEVLFWGDGNEYGVYYTTSSHLARDVLCLCLELGIKPRYGRRGEMWQVYTGLTNDGFDATKHTGWEWGTIDRYQLTVEDYSTILVGKNGRFQWISVSAVS